MNFAQQYAMVCRSLRPDQKRQGRLALSLLIRRRGFDAAPFVIRQRVVAAVGAVCPLANATERDALAFYVLGRLAWVMTGERTNGIGTKRTTGEESSAERERWAERGDSIAEMSAMDMLLLQQMMDKKTQLEVMISNVMKAGYEGGQAAITALKGS
jgi:hypothetical protein